MRERVVGSRRCSAVKCCAAGGGKCFAVVLKSYGFGIRLRKRSRCDWPAPTGRRAVVLSGRRAGGRGRGPGPGRGRGRPSELDDGRELGICASSGNQRFYCVWCCTSRKSEREGRKGKGKGWCVLLLYSTLLYSATLLYCYTLTLVRSSCSNLLFCSVLLYPICPTLFYSFLLYSATLCYTLLYSAAAAAVAGWACCRLRRRLGAGQRRLCL